MHFAQIRLVLERGGTAEAHRVAEVVHDGAAHNGVEVDYRDSLSRGCVQQHVVELGIVVRHTERKYSFLKLLHKDTAVILACQYKLYFFTAKSCPVLHIFPQCVFEITETLHRIVELRNRLIETLGRIIPQLLQNRTVPVSPPSDSTQNPVHNAGSAMAVRPHLQNSSLLILS